MSLASHKCKGHQRITVTKHTATTYGIESVVLKKTIGLVIKGVKTAEAEWCFAPLGDVAYRLSTLNDIMSVMRTLIDQDELQSDHDGRLVDPKLNALVARDADADYY